LGTLQPIELCGEKIQIYKKHTNQIKKPMEIVKLMMELMTWVERELRIRFESGVR
jgi:hypothetical protein